VLLQEANHLVAQSAEIIPAHEITGRNPHMHNIGRIKPRRCA